MNGITKNTFKEADTDTKLDILFDYVKDIHQMKKVCDTRFDALENRKIKDSAFAAGTGFIGGFAAMIAKLKIF